MEKIYLGLRNWKVYLQAPKEQPFLKVSTCKKLLALSIDFKMSPKPLVLLHWNQSNSNLNIFKDLSFYIFSNTLHLKKLKSWKHKKYGVE